MGTSFTELERINLAAKALAAGVKDADPTTQWYESANAFSFVVAADKVWLQSELVKQNPAATVFDARALASGALLGVIQDYSQPSGARQLTAVPGVNNSFVALNTPGDFSSGVLDGWVQPQFVPQANGLPSFGYAVRLYDGDPAAGGSEIFTTDGVEGTGINKSVAWVWDYHNGLLLHADGYSIADPYVLGFVYVGSTAVDLSGSFAPWHEDEFAATGGQTIFVLTYDVAEVESFSLSVNGVMYDDDVDYSRSGKTITWLVPFNLENGDLVVARYKRG